MPEQPARRSALDQHLRDLVSEDLETTFLVEASAGTGKTSLLVDRYVACVLGGKGEPGDVRRVAAITFTEKAAGELRQRIREKLETLAAGEAEHPGSADGGREALARALDALDDAPISTIHGFAGRLLREFSVAAGIDPAFEQLDQLSGELQAAQLWEEWLIELAADAPGDDHELGEVRQWLGLLLATGVRLSSLRDLAIGAKGWFGERYDLAAPPVPDEAPDLAVMLRGLDAAREQLRRHCVEACLDQADKGFGAAMQLIGDLDGCDARWAGACSLEEQAAGLFALSFNEGTSGPGGAQKNWAGGKAGKEALLAAYKAVTDEIRAVRDAYATYVTSLALAVVHRFSSWAGTTQLELGRLDFTDLLGQLRALVRDKGFRGDLQQRFDYILVDEFQDTDPLQAESVVLLCEREPLADDWRQAMLEPGKLFVVGDPKQSIYRFRRADISLYDDVKELVTAQGDAGRILVISQNFRTTPLLIDWVNDVFATVFAPEPHRQPAYNPVVASRPALDGLRTVVLLGDGEGNADAQRRAEAEALAALLIGLRDGDERWWVRRRRCTDGGPEDLRPAGLGDVAVLFRTTTDMETYEQAFRAAGVPYRVEGGATYFQRREVDDALLCLRAVDDPTDGPAVYGALHSSLFGFSDDDLFLFWAAGGRFDVFAPAAGAGEESGVFRQPGGHDDVVAALAILRRLHEQRTGLEVHEVVERLLRATHAEELQAATGDGALQALANLEKLVERARAFSAAGGGGLGAFRRWAAEAGEGAGEQESAVEDNEDVVRILTIHKAKGLQFPITVLAGASLGSAWRGGEPLVDRAAGRLLIKLKTDLPGVSCELKPDAYARQEELEKRMAELEARRLLYVAATRAEDRLVLSLFAPLTNKDGTAKKVLLAALNEVLPVPGSALEEGEHNGMAVLVPGEPVRRARPAERADVEALLSGRALWSAARERLLQHASRPAPATSPSALEHIDEEARTGGPGAPPGRADALALGSAVHRIMQLCDLRDAAGLDRLAGEVCAELGRPGLEGHAARLAAACWRAPTVRAAAASAEVYRELPVGVLVGEAVVSGAVDLLYRDGDAWIVVDYKTDRVTDLAVLRERYEVQGAAYALAVEAALDQTVREVVLVAAAAQDEVVLPLSDALRVRARAAVAAATAAGRPWLADAVE